MIPQTLEDIRRHQRRAIRDVWRRARVTGQRTPIEWARAERRLGRGTGPLASDECIPYIPEVMPWMEEPTNGLVDPSVQVTVLWWASGMGKSLALDTPLPTPSGWTTMGKVRAGDLLFDETGRVCRVLVVNPIRLNRPCYRVKFNDGSEIVADAEHLWEVDRSVRKSEGGRKDRTRKISRYSCVVTTEEIKKTIRRGATWRYGIRVSLPVKCPEIKTLISPYMLGLWLGDGDHGYARISAGLLDMEETMRHIREDGHIPNARIYAGRCADISIDVTKRGQKNIFLDGLRKLGVFRNKHVPSIYLRGSISQRLALLQGLMDSDGTIDKTGCSASFTASRKELSEGVFELVASLGMKPRISNRITKCQNGASCLSWKVSFFPTLPIFRLHRKLERIKASTSTQPGERRIIAVESCNSVPVRCIGVDSKNHLFLCGKTFIPTHNTEVAVNGIGYCVDESPRNIFAVYPKEESRDKFSRDVIDRAIEATPALNEKFSAKKSRDSGNTIGYKKYFGGSLYMTSAGSASNFRGPRAGFVYCDEIDGYPEDVDGEGDPIYLAFRRAEGFKKAIKLLSGTGTFEPETQPDGTILYRSRIHAWYEKSDKRKWFCRCRECGEPQTTKFEQIWAPDGHPEKAVYLCEKCEAQHNPDQWLTMVKNGVWQPTAEFTGVRGYWINAFSTTLPAEKGYASKLHQFYVDGRRAMKDPAERRVFINTVKAELVEAETGGEAPPDWTPIYNRREGYIDEHGKGAVPTRGLLIHAGVDLQKNRIEVNWKAYGRNEESFGLEHTVLPGEVQDPQVWKDLEKELLRKFTHASGAEMELALGFIDSSKWPDWVFRFLSDLRKNGSPLAGRVRACRGSNQYPHPLVAPKYSKLAKNLAGHWVGGDVAKDLIYSRIQLPTPAEGAEIPEGYHHYSEAFPSEYFQQLTAERVTVKYVNGEEIRRFQNPTRARNEALDCEVYGLAAFRLHTWRFSPEDWNALAAKFEKYQAKAEGGALPEPEPEEEEPYTGGRGWNL